MSTRAAGTCDNCGTVQGDGYIACVECLYGDPIADNQRALKQLALARTTLERVRDDPQHGLDAWRWAGEAIEGMEKCK